MSFLIAKQGFLWWTRVAFITVVDQGGIIEIPEQPKLLLKQKVALQSDSVISLQKKKIYVTKHRGVKMEPTWIPHSYVLSLFGPEE